MSVHLHCYVVTTDRTRKARARLDAAIRERDAADREVRAAVREAHDAGLTQVDIAELTGLHRNTVRAYLRDG